jgi:hypothetical protein
MSDIDNFVTLFRGRGDCYGSDEGGCVRKPLERQTFVDHLEGKSGIGVYPAVPSSTPFCVWGCSDIDVEDLPSARLLQRTLKTAGVMSWVERSRSKGYHVWVFAQDRVPAEDMRRMLLAAHQVADYPAREVNPKQSDVSAHKVGNYVRLPYLGGLVDTPQRRVILDDYDTPMPLDVFVYHAMRDRTPVERIQFLASHYVPPARVAPSIDFSSLTDEDLEEALRNTSPLARVIWKQGPLESQDRSTALMRLAHVCYRSGVTPSMCRVIVVDADKRWGKYHLRGDAGQAEINKIVERAYRG